MSISQDSKQRPIAITMGDPAGIGSEIIAKLLADSARPRCPILVIGDAGIMTRGMNATKVDLHLPMLDSVSDLEAGSHCLLQVGSPLPDDLRWGEIDPRGGIAAYSYIERAIDLALAGKVDAIVTAPINKAALFAAGLTFPGHTEILAARCGSAEVGMMLADQNLRVMLVSVHLSLAEAISEVTLENELRAIRLAEAGCRQRGIAAPRIAVAGLNPHAGEGGLFGSEEIEIIAPAIQQARDAGIVVSGPYPADTIFMRARQGEFDAVVAQYHDQGLIPIKLLGIEQGVNQTVGLPFIRTSVDHGTAYDIAGKGIADASSLSAAVAAALEITAARTASGARR